MRRAAAGLRLALLPPLTILAAAIAPAEGRAQDFRGTVISGSDSLPIPGSTVLLHRVTTNAGVVVDSTRTDASGRFALTVAEEDEPGALYVAAALSGGVSYFGPALHPGMDVPDPYLIVVHETERITVRPVDSSIRFRHVVVAPTAHGLVQVTDVIDIDGRPDRALAMEPETEPIWVLELPAGVQSWSPIQGGLAGEALSLTDRRVEVRAVLPPSGMRVAFNYYREGPGVDLTSAYPTDRIEVILVDAEAERLEGLEPGRPTDLPSRGTAARFVASGVGAGEAVGLVLAVESPPRGPALTWVVIGLIMLAAAALSAAWARRAPT